MKYVIFEDEAGCRFPIIFPDVFVHSDMAEYTQYQSMDKLNKFVKPVSAGFISLKGECFGESESLNLKSDKEMDTDLCNFGDSLYNVSKEMLPILIAKLRNPREQVHYE